MPVRRIIIDEYLQAMPDMMENETVWETIKNRSPEQKDSFLYDRFMSSCRQCFKALNSGSTYDEWFVTAASLGIEPILAQYAYDMAKKGLKSGLSEDLLFPLSGAKKEVSHG